MTGTPPTAGTSPRWAFRLGLAGGALGVVAGVIQAAFGAEIPEWTGGKSNPVGLGLLTVVLSEVAVGCAVLLGREWSRPATRFACGAGLLLPGSLCFSTVGLLWYVPGALLLSATAVALLGDGPLALLQVLEEYGFGVLVSVLGGLEMLMAAGSLDPLIITFRGVGGLALAVAPWLPDREMRWLVAILGTVPFAVLAWESLVPVVLALLAAALATVAFQSDPRRSPAAATGGR